VRTDVEHDAAWHCYIFRPHIPAVPEEFAVRTGPVVCDDPPALAPLLRFRRYP